MNKIEGLALLITLSSNVAGQMFFKVAAAHLKQSEQPIVIAYIANPWLWAALTGYGITTITWVWVLQTVPLSIAYPLMALTFVLVPVLGVAFFGETASLRFYIGVCVVALGVWLTSFRPV